MLFATGAGGIAFDRVAWSMPFTMMAGVNMLVALLAFGVLMLRPAAARA